MSENEIKQSSYEILKQKSKSTNKHELEMRKSINKQTSKNKIKTFLLKNKIKNFYKINS